MMHARPFFEKRLQNIKDITGKSIDTQIPYWLTRHYGLVLKRLWRSLLIGQHVTRVL